jgi:hypothetical protein
MRQWKMQKWSLPEDHQHHRLLPLALVPVVLAVILLEELDNHRGPLTCHNHHKLMSLLLLALLYVLPPLIPLLLVL